jgi:hypothetical protein
VIYNDVNEISLITGFILRNKTIMIMRRDKTKRERETKNNKKKEDNNEKNSRRGQKNRKTFKRGRDIPVTSD